MPLTRGRDKRNLVPNTLGLNENHSSEGVWGRRKKNKRAENWEEEEKTTYAKSEEVARKWGEACSCFMYYLYVPHRVRPAHGCQEMKPAVGVVEKDRWGQRTHQDSLPIP